MGLLLGLVFGLYGYVMKSDPEEGLSYKKLARTMFVYALAGLLVAVEGNPITFGMVEAKVAYTIVFGEVFDKLWSWARRRLREKDG